MKQQIDHVDANIQHASHVTIINNITQLLGSNKTFDLDELNKRMMSSPMVAFQPSAIVIDALATADATSQPQSMMQLTVDYLAQDRKSVMLIQGEAGGGKTVFCHSLVNHVINNSELDYIPLYIPLPLLDDIKGDLIAQALGLYGLHSKEIDYILTEHKNTRFLFIFDSYDEVPEFSNTRKSNLYVTSKLNQWGQSKCIFACRDSFLVKEKKVNNLFAPFDGEQFANARLQSVHLTCFNNQQIKKYIDSYLELNQTQLEQTDLGEQWLLADTYFTYFRNNPHLPEIVQNPFMLSVTVQSLPLIANSKALTNDSLQHYRFTDYELVQVYIESFFDRQEDKVTALTGDVFSDFTERCYDYCHELIVYMNAQNTPLTELRYNRTQRDAPENSFFLDKDNDVLWTHARKAAPIIGGPECGFLAFRHEKFAAFLLEHYQQKLLAQRNAARRNIHAPQPALQQPTNVQRLPFFTNSSQQSQQGSKAHTDTNEFKIQ